MRAAVGFLVDQPAAPLDKGGGVGGQCPQRIVGEAKLPDAVVRSGSQLQQASERRSRPEGLDERDTCPEWVLAPTPRTNSAARAAWKAA